MTTRTLLPCFVLMLAAGTGGCSGSGRDDAPRPWVAFDVSPDGDRIVFTSAGGDLFLLELASGVVTRLTETTAIESDPSFAPDGNSVLHASNAGDDSSATHIHQLALDTGASIQLTHDAGVSDSDARYSDDGTQIVFARATRYRPRSMGGWTWSDWDVHVADADGNHVRRLTRENYYSLAACQFATDARSIVYSATPNYDQGQFANQSIFGLDAMGTATPVQQVPAAVAPVSGGDVPHHASTSDPDLSPDGRWMVVISDRGNPFHYDLMRVDLQTDAILPLQVETQGAGRYPRNPRFAGRAKRILFLDDTSDAPGGSPQYTLWSVDLDGGNAHQIADRRLFTDPLAWTPTKD